MISVREATAADCSAIKRLIDQLGYPVTEAEVETRLQLIQASGQAALVAEADGKVVGCLSTSTMLVLHRPAPVGRIAMMVIDEQYRNRRIGAQLVAAAERLLAKRGCELVEVTSNNRRIDAHRFWEANGYERTSTRFAKAVDDRP